MRKITADRAAGVDFEIEVSGDTPATFCVLYRSSNCEAQAQIEGGFNDKGKHDWLIYAETLTYIRTGMGFKQTHKQSAEILDKMKNGMMCLGMDCSII
jgi:hypothetical protein